jgi:hypothetical protein
MRHIVALIVVLFFVPCASASQPYHIELEANPAAAFPYLAMFGKVEIHVYRSGVRSDALWLNAFSRNGAPVVTVANPLGRTYAEVPLSEIAPFLTKLAGAAGAIERNAASPILEPPTSGTVRGIKATRHRLMYGPAAWIDYWTTDAVPENAQLRAIVEQLVAGISPPTVSAARQIRGMPVYIELNFRRFKKVPLLQLKKLTFAVDDEEDALELGPLYIRSGGLESMVSD